MTIIEDLTSIVSLSSKEPFLQAVNPVTKERLPEKFRVATSTDIDKAVQQANHAWQRYKNTNGQERANLLRTIAQEIENLGETLIQKVQEESGLSEGRIIGERGRTINQLHQFADLVEAGHWVDATIQQSADGVNIRKMLIPIGPVAVFTASNFPLAFSTAGGDTISALAAGCSVIVKAHPSHLGTNALVTTAINRAIEKCNLPSGIFSSLNGKIEVGQTLVQHPLLKAVGFTGSHRGGKALMDLANSRRNPIPVYAEMGSINPVFILPEKIKSDVSELTTKIANSVNLGAGQFCTNPGLLILEKDNYTNQFIHALKTAFSNLSTATMLNEGIFKAYENGKRTCLNSNGVTSQFGSNLNKNDWVGNPAFATISAKNFLQQPTLQNEIFGPFTLIILCENRKEVQKVAKNLNGQLTATLLGETKELQNAATLIELLIQKAGRVIFNDVPTGVTVCPAMHHGGPYPSTSNGFYTSVGTDAIKRFVRPIAFQNMPDILLPDALKAANPLNIWRKVNGKKVKA